MTRKTRIGKQTQIGAYIAGAIVIGSVIYSPIEAPSYCIRQICYTLRVTANMPPERNGLGGREHL
jgi:hypothetical protein